jgi:hypothetical protein
MAEIRQLELGEHAVAELVRRHEQHIADHELDQRLPFRRREALETRRAFDEVALDLDKAGGERTWGRPRLGLRGRRCRLRQQRSRPQPQQQKQRTARKRKFRWHRMHGGRLRAGHGKSSVGLANE